MNKIVDGSMFKKICKLLFIDGSKNYFDNSRILKFLSKICQPKLALVFLLISIGCFWYEGLFNQIGIWQISTYNIASIFLILALIFCDKRQLKTTKSTIYLLIFCLIMVVSGLVASLSGLVVGMLIGGILLFIHFVLAYLIASTFKNKNSIINWLIILSTPLIIFGLFQGFLGQETSKLWVSTSETLIDSRSFGFFGSPNVMGAVMMIISIISLFRLIDSKKIRYLSPFILSSVVMITTYSRSAWLGYGSGILIALIVKNWRFIMILPFGFIGLLIPSIKQRIMTMLSQSYMVDSALDGRVWSLNNAIEIYKTSPLIGTGPGSYGGQMAINYNSPIYLNGMQNGYVALAYTDNQWIQLAVQFGLLGVLSIAGFFISYFVSSLRQYIKDKNILSLGFIAVIIAVFVSGLFENILEFGAVSVLAGVYLGLGNHYE